ncbi:MAG: protein phosphatase 2C domain-containing protein [Bacteroidia bacterium]|nr:protein phosphatase 2C domain-containing protein [Bacteroidia bacterium]
MKIVLKQPLSLHETGGQSLNEDFIFPLSNQANPGERLFIVCDGEGGPDAGDVASKLTALSVAKYFASTPLPDGAVNQAYLDTCLAITEEALSAYRESHPESKAMSTSLALLHVGDTQVTMAWIGTCRVYHFDQLKRNIFRPMVAPGSDPASHEPITGKEAPRRMNAHFLPLSAVHKDDYFFLATDGVYEQADDATLETIFREGHKSSPEGLLGEIRNLCENFTRDNYACYLIQVAQTEASAAAEAPADADPSTVHRVDTEQAASWVRNGLIAGVGVAALVVLLIVLWIMNRPKPTLDTYLTQIQQQLDQGQPAQAQPFFGPAYQAAKSPADSLRVQRLEETWRIATGDTLMTAAVKQVEAYIEQGREYLSRRNYADAVNAFEQAEAVKAQRRMVMPDLPQDQVAEAYLRRGDTLYTQKTRDCELATASYRKGLKFFESPERQPADTLLLARAKNRLAECEQLIAQAIQPPKTPPVASGTRSAGEAGGAASAPASGNLADLSSPAEGTVPAGAASRKAAPASAPATGTAPAPKTPAAAPQSATRAPAAPAASAAEQKKALDAGNRLYDQAGRTNSASTYAQAAAQYEAAAAALDGPGAYRLSYIYHMGLGGKKDPAKALTYAKKSADKGWSAGQYLYAHMLLERNNPKDTLTAKTFLRKSAEQGYRPAIERLNRL